MKKLSIFSLLCLILLFLGTGLAGAQGFKQGSGNGDWKPDDQYSHNYDLNSVETLSGEVMSVNSFMLGRGMARGIHLKLKTSKGKLNVHLGPAWFLDQQNTRIEAQDQIEVTGSKIAKGSETYMIASQIKKGDSILQLRDERGFPVWSGWKRLR